MHMPGTPLLRQPQVAVGTVACAFLIGMVDWINSPAHLTGPHFVLGIFLFASMVLGSRFPIRLPQATAIFVGTVPMYLAAVLLPPPCTIVVVAAGTVGGEFAIRFASRMHLSDIATQGGRLTLIALAGSMVAHIPTGPHLSSMELLPAAALVMWLGDITTSPLLLTPLSGQVPRNVIRAGVMEAGPIEASHYVVGVLGALAAMQALWSVALLSLPIGLIYLAFKSAKDMHESARQLLAGVVETSPNAIALLDLTGSVILANRQAAALYGYGQPGDMVGERLIERVDDAHRDQAELDVKRALERDTVMDRQYTLHRTDGATFVAEMSWSPILDKQGKLKALTSMARDITDRKAAEQALVRQASHDALTRLPNRALFHDRLTDALIRGSEEDLPFALFLLDLDRFKQVNDTYGHHYGDLLLQQVARRLRRCVRDTDTVARLGGDEFAVLLPSAEAEGAGIVASRVRNAIAAPYTVEGQTLDVDVSIGISLYPGHGEEAQLLLHRADVAMYIAKQAKQGCAFYHTDQESTRPALTETADATGAPAV